MFKTRFMEIFLPSPFSSNPQPVEHKFSTGAVVQSIEVTDSELFCEYCGEVTTDGTYVPDAKRLSWVCCACGASNVVRGIDL